MYIKVLLIFIIELVNDNLMLKGELCARGLMSQSLGKSSESMKQAMQSMKNKESVLAAEREVKMMLKSTLDDLAQVNEKAIEIEMEHIRVVKELEKQLMENTGGREDVVDR
jgi:hypothetical protein